MKIMLSIRELGEKFNNSRNFKGSVLPEESMKDHTTMKVGGNAALFIQPEDTESLVFAVSECKKNGVRFFTSGGGSNLVFTDEGFHGIIISTLKMNAIQQIDDTHIKCGAGVLSDDLVNFCAEKGIAGTETFAGLPGTVGGAAFMNARCYGKEMSDILSSAEYIEAEKITDFSDKFIEEYVKIYHNDKDRSDWAYKHSPLASGSKIIVSVTIEVSPADLSKKPSLCAECKKYVDDRTQKGHFKFPSSGSVFKNDRNFGKPSGVLIDEAGLKGTRIGGAQVAPFHGNIIINAENATASDVKQLVEYVQQKIKEKDGYLLEPEVIFVN